VLTFNARIAVNLGAPVLLAVNGHERSPETITHIAQRCLNEVSAAHARCAAIIANRCDPEHLDEIRMALATTGVPGFSLPEVALLAAPTMAELCEALGGTLYSGDPELLRREALSMMVGGMNAEHILERLTEGQVVIVPADRSEVLLAATTLTANRPNAFHTSESRKRLHWRSADRRTPRRAPGLAVCR
jgi:phosphate acetyltransferase